MRTNEALRVMTGNNVFVFLLLFRCLNFGFQEWLRQNPSPNAADAAQKKRSLTDNPIIARVLAAIS